MNLLKRKVKTTTLDDGFEFAKHESIAKAWNANTYIAHSYVSWERRINENTNGNIFPKAPIKKFDGNEPTVQSTPIRSRW